MFKLFQKSQKKDEFTSYQKEVELSIKNTQKRIASEQKRKLPSLSHNPLEQIKLEIAEYLKKYFNADSSIITEINIELAPSHIEADLTVSTFELAKILKSNPTTIAQKLAEIINQSNSSLIDKAEVINGFINLSLKQASFYSSILKEINEQKEEFGSSNVNAKRVAVMDYSSPNVAKPIGVAHMRSTNIGQALKNISEKTGYSVIGHNYIGDWGTQFGKLIYAYQTWGDKNKIKQNPLNELKNLYVKFHEEAEKNPELEDKAREIFKKLEKKDEKLLALWKEFRDLSIEGIKKTYQRLGINFDLWIGESYFNEKSREIIQECLDKKLGHQVSQTGAIVADPSDNLPTFLLQKQDGTTLYSARDLANLKFRLEKFNPDQILYIVGDDQKLYFSQIINIAQHLNWFANKPQVQIEHIGFGLVLSDGKKMSTRKGSLVELEDLINESVNQAKKIIKQKNQNLDEKDIKEIAEILGIGAIIYNDLRQSRTRNVSFNWDKMFSFEGGSSVYLQYTYVRIQSILRKIAQTTKAPKNICFESAIELHLAKKLAFFPFVIIKAEKFKSPHLIATYLEELAQLFNGFYNEIKIIETQDQDLLNSRIMLVTSVASTIKNGLSLLNIKTPKRM